MRILVDKMPTEARECIFSNIATGKYRCRHNALLCPIARGGECKFLMELPSQPEPVVAVDSPEPVSKVEPKKRSSKKSTPKGTE